MWLSELEFKFEAFSLFTFTLQPQFQPYRIAITVDAFNFSRYKYICLTVWRDRERDRDREAIEECVLLDGWIKPQRSILKWKYFLPFSFMVPSTKPI